MRAMGRNPTEDEIMQIMNEIDVDHNGNKKIGHILYCLNCFSSQHFSTK